MALIVQKYGGSSLESADRIRAVAERIVATKKQGHDVVVVCSAMGDTTDELLDLAAQVNPVPPQREQRHGGRDFQRSEFVLSGDTGCF